MLLLTSQLILHLLRLFSPYFFFPPKLCSRGCFQVLHPPASASCLLSAWNLGVHHHAWHHMSLKLLHLETEKKVLSVLHLFTFHYQRRHHCLSQTPFSQHLACLNSHYLLGSLPRFCTLGLSVRSVLLSNRGLVAPQRKLGDV